MKTLARTCAPLGLLLVLAGCAGYREDPIDPVLEMAALRERDLVLVSRAAPEGARGDGMAFDASDGLSEAETVAAALVLNPELQAKRRAAGEAEALLITAGQWPNPVIDFGLRAGIAGASGVAIEGDALFELLRQGERSGRMESARANVAEVNADILADEAKTVIEVRTQWLAVLAAEQAVRLLDEELALRERAATLVRQRRELGESTELEVSVTQLELAEVRRDRRKAQTEAERERRELNRLVGLPPAYELRLSDSGRPITVVVYDDPTDEDLDRRVLAGRPELQAKLAAYRRAEAELRVAVLGQYPKLGLGPSFERELEGDHSLGLGLSLELPLFNQNQGEIAEKLAQRQRLRAEFVALLHRLRADAHAARADLRRARHEVETQENEVLPLIRRNQELFEGAYRARELSVVDWVTAQQRGVRARREYEESLIRYRNALVRLEAATGSSLVRSPNPTTRPAPATRPNE